jgi:hypothetical protein
MYATGSLTTQSSGPRFNCTFVVVVPPQCLRGIGISREKQVSSTTHGRLWKTMRDYQVRVCVWRRDCHPSAFSGQGRRRPTDVLPVVARADGDILRRPCLGDDVISGVGNIASYRPIFAASGRTWTEGHMRRYGTNSAQPRVIMEPSYVVLCCILRCLIPNDIQVDQVLFPLDYRLSGPILKFR